MIQAVALFGALAVGAPRSSGPDTQMPQQPECEPSRYGSVGISSEFLFSGSTFSPAQMWIAGLKVLTKPFLHLHTQFSLLDGANQIEPLVQQIKSFGQPAVAMTDHGNMFGAIEFYRKAKDAGVKPIIGCEVYVAPASRFDRKTASGGRDVYHHLVLLAKDETGYRNLIRLATAGGIVIVVPSPERSMNEAIWSSSAGSMATQ